MIYEFKMPLLPTMNEIINTARSGWQPSNKLKKQWTNKIANFVKNCGFTLNDKIWIEFHWYLRNFGRDADNTAAAAKFIMDGLVSAKAIHNDNLTVIQSPVVHYYHPRWNLKKWAGFLGKMPDTIQINWFIKPAHFFTEIVKLFW